MFGWDEEKIERSCTSSSICPGCAVLKQDAHNRTGVHTVADVFCVGCGDRIGWYYHKAADFSQKYKEGMMTFCSLWGNFVLNML